MMIYNSHHPKKVSSFHVPCTKIGVIWSHWLKECISCFGESERMWVCECVSVYAKEIERVCVCVEERERKWKAILGFIFFALNLIKVLSFVSYWSAAQKLNLKVGFNKDKMRKMRDPLSKWINLLPNPSLIEAFASKDPLFFSLWWVFIKDNLIASVKEKIEQIIN